MRARRWIAALLLMAVSATAGAAAGADFRLTGDGVDLDVVLDASGEDFEFGSFDISLAPGQTVTETFDYTVTLSDGGLPVSRQWMSCTPIFETDCGPVATGYEQAYSSVWMGRDPRYSTTDDYLISDASVFLSFLSVSDSSTTFSGTITYTATNTSDLYSQSAMVGIMAADFVDAAVVPEPPAWTMLLLALAGLSMLRVPRSRPRDAGRRSA